VARRVFDWANVRAALVERGAAETAGGGEEVVREVGSASSGRR
jgi:hypothetical protein